MAIVGGGQVVDVKNMVIFMVNDQQNEKY